MKMKNQSEFEFLLSKQMKKSFSFFNSNRNRNRTKVVVPPEPYWNWVELGVVTPIREQGLYFKENRPRVALAALRKVLEHATFGSRPSLAPLGLHLPVRFRRVGHDVQRQRARRRAFGLGHLF
jgi:hypothetical protein